MRIKFDILFELEVKHEYFSDGHFEECDIRPTENTAQLMLDYGLFFKKTSNGFVILYEIDTTDLSEPPLKAMSSVEKFSFEMYMRSPYFTNYTEIPLNHKLPHFFYFNNLDDNIVGGDLMLSKQNYVGEEDEIELASDVYTINKTTTGLKPVVEVLDLQGSSIFSKPIYAPDKRLNYQLELGRLGSGRFEIKVEGAHEKDLYSSQKLNRKSLFAILEVHKSDSVPPGYRFIEADGTISKKVYTIRFARRTTTWKYFVLLRNILSNPGLSIAYGSRVLPEEEAYPASVNFNQKPIATLTPSELSIVNEYGSDKVLVFESDVELPMYETPKKNINLLKPDTDDAGSEPDIVIGSLPNASTAAIKTNGANTKSFSEIFIHV